MSYLKKKLKSDFDRDKSEFGRFSDFLKFHSPKKLLWNIENPSNISRPEDVSICTSKIYYPDFLYPIR